MKDFSVIVLHYNAPVFLEGALDSLSRATEGLDAEIIVADNASAHFDVRYFKSRFPAVRFILHPRNYGFARGNNLAVNEAGGEYVFLVNPDVLVPEDVFRRLMPRLRQTGDLGLAGIRLTDGHGRFLPESKRRTPSVWGIAGKIRSRRPGDLWSRGYYDYRLDETSDGETDVLVGAFMGFRRADYLAVGGLDERYFMYGEDIDLSYTMRRMGKRNVYFGSVSALHFKGESTPDDPAFRRHFSRASLLFFRKYYPLLAPLVQPFSAAILHRWTHRTKRKMPVPRKDFPVLYYAGNRREVAGRLARTFPGKEIQRIGPDGHPRQAGWWIWDPATYSYKEILARMEALRESPHAFRLLTPDGNFIYGSDLPQGKGEIIRLS